VKNISLFFSKKDNQSLQQNIMSRALANDNINFCIFADKNLNINDTRISILPIASLLSFKGEVICVTAQDVKTVISLKRDIKVKLSLGENLLELADLFQYDDIEYLTGVHEVEKNEYNDTIELLYNSFLGLKVGKIKTLNEYLL
jgi:hypothetical protein